MKKIIIGIVAVLAVGVGGFVAAVSMQPAVTNVERSITVDATAADIFPLVNDYNTFITWSPWTDLDPNQTTEISDPAAGEGAWYTWKGNEDVGSGKMSTTKVVENESVTQDLEFFEPFESKAEVSYILVAEGEGTKVTWAFTTNNNFGAKMAGMFMDMDAMLGADFDKGLGKLKPLAEQAKTDRVAEEQAAEEAAKAAAEAEAGEEGQEGEDSEG